MSLENELQVRSGEACELCSTKNNLKIYKIPPAKNGVTDECIYACNTCIYQIENPETTDVNHWRCLNESMWSQTPAVQVMVWRMLSRLKAEAWSHDLLDMLYLDEETLAWAKANGEGENQEDILKHLDCNGVILAAGDSVVLIQDLNVKGAGFTAKRGTAVRRISLVEDNPEHIEGKVNGQQIVILTKFVKKTS